MTWITKMELIGLAVGVLGITLIAPFALASRPAHPYRYSIVDMPVSFAVGTIRTPEFSPPQDELAVDHGSGRETSSVPANDVHDGRDA